MEDRSNAGLNPETLRVVAALLDPERARTAAQIGIAVGYAVGGVFLFVGLAGATFALMNGYALLALIPLLFGTVGVSIAALAVRSNRALLRRLSTPPETDKGAAN